MQDWKLIHRPDVLKSLKEGHPPPVSVQIILSDLCNQDCAYCAYRMSGYPSNQMFKDEHGNKNPKRQLDTDLVLKLLEDLQAMGVNSVEFTGGGEPTIHPDFARIVMDARSKGFGIGVITNAMKLSDEALDALNGISWVRVSIDAAKAETYSKVRGIGKAAFNHVLSNLSKIKSQVLSVSFVVTKENYLEIEQFDKLIRDKVSYIRYADRWGVEKGYYSVPMLSKIRAQLKPEAWDSFWERFQQQFAKPRYSACQQQRINTYVGGDANVYRCCHYAYNPHGVLGSLKVDSFPTIWQRQEEAFKQFDARSCDSCPFNMKNKFINYALSDAVHTNFL